MCFIEEGVFYYPSPLFSTEMIKGQRYNQMGPKNLDLGEPMVGFFTCFISVLNKNRRWAVIPIFPSLLEYIK